MCMLCGETAAQGRKEARALAQELRRLASYQDGLASGAIEPHGEDSKGIGALALSIVRELVMGYI